MVIPQDSPDLEPLQEQIDRLLAEAKRMGVKVPQQNICLRDGDQSGRDEYANCMTIKGSNSRTIATYDHRVRKITDEDEGASLFYGGSYANAMISLWLQANKFGKRVNCNLESLQFAGHGERFGAQPIDDTELYAPVDIGDDASGFEEVEGAADGYAA